jgi:hypothetical protein
MVAMRQMVHDKKITDIMPRKVAGSKRKRDGTVKEKPDDPVTMALEINRKAAQEKKRRSQQNKAVGFLEKRIQDRLAGIKPSNERTPTDVIAAQILKNEKKDKTHIVEALKGLSTHRPTGEQAARLVDASQLGPNYLGRTASLVPGHRWGLRAKRATNGFTTCDLMMPAADTNEKQAQHKHILRMRQGRVVYTVGHQLFGLIPLQMSSFLIARTFYFC